MLVVDGETTDELWLRLQRMEKEAVELIGLQKQQQEKIVLLESICCRLDYADIFINFLSSLSKDQFLFLVFHLTVRVETEIIFLYVCLSGCLFIVLCYLNVRSVICICL